ncbi:hypothetical protein Micbo1qcDRAFT_223619 [Microdochium bolleyi]|uniref:Uncharacterized protein n=1 Tax=Microdochium bolleyi TaxID=196109 RepID=A0A136IJT2_9PEZI|nr:hypothetical protein Micbo1qcDRAFT_223619 [Microdochium bolleyi]
MSSISNTVVYTVPAALAGVTALVAVSLCIANGVVLRKTTEVPQTTFRTVTTPLLLLFIGAGLGLAQAVYALVGPSSSSSTSSTANKTLLITSVLSTLGVVFIRAASILLLLACVGISLDTLARLQPTEAHRHVVTRRLTITAATVAWLLTLASAAGGIARITGRTERLVVYLPGAAATVFYAILVLGFAGALWPVLALSRAAKGVVRWSVNIPATLIAAIVIAWIYSVVSLGYFALAFSNAIGARSILLNNTLLVPFGLAVQVIMYLFPLVALTILFAAGLRGARHGVWRPAEHGGGGGVYYDQAYPAAGDGGGLQYMSPYQQQQQEYYFATQQQQQGPVEMEQQQYYNQRQRPVEMNAGPYSHHGVSGHAGSPPPPGYELDAQGMYAYGKVPQPVNYREVGS